MDELLDIIDQNDKVIGQKLRSQIYNQNLSNFRVVNAFLINDNGELWIPRRSKDKDMFPLCLDTSMGGHVASGETYDEAFRRELMEELNIDANTIAYEHISTFNPHQHNMSAFMQVYLIRTNKSPNFNTDDFIEYLWLAPQKLIKRLEDNSDKAKSDLLKLVKILF